MNLKIIFLVGVIALFWIGSITGFLLLQNEPAAIQVSESSDEKLEKIIIPIKVHMVFDEESFFSSGRDEENIARVFEQANMIWNPAEIFFEVKEISFTTMDNSAVTQSIEGYPAQIRRVEGVVTDKINVFFVKHLSSINGLAFPAAKIVLVADFTSVNDFRTTAHELGHILGLKHTDISRNYLMFRGANGEFMSEDEINSARLNAKLLIESYLE